MNTYGKIEEALKKCEEKFSKDFRESPLVLTLTSAVDHRYLDVNQAFERVSGWERKEVIGRTPFDLGIWVYPNERLAFERRLLAGETIHGLEVRARMRHGELRTISGSAILMENSFEPVGGLLDDSKPSFLKCGADEPAKRLEVVDHQDGGQVDQH